MTPHALAEGLIVIIDLQEFRPQVEMIFKWNLNLIWIFAGHGDILMRACLAADVVKRMDYKKESLQTACESACKRMYDDFKGTGGVIGIDKSGQIGIHFTSQRMAWAYQRGSKMHFGIRKKDDYEQEVQDEDFESDNE